MEQKNDPNQADVLDELLENSNTDSHLIDELIEPADTHNQPIKIDIESVTPTKKNKPDTDYQRSNIHLQTSAIEKPQRRKRPSKLFLLTALILLGYLGWRILPATYSSNTSGEYSFSFWKSFSLLTKFKLGVDQRVVLSGEEQDRINFVLLGIGGKGHDGGNLTDTIMVGSFRPSTKKVVLMSIPRDLSVPITGYGWKKINSANSLAELRDPGSGALATAQLVGDILEIPIHYYLRIDFAGFVKTIDDLGGVKVDVENTINDYAYPVMGREDHPDYYSRFEHLYIEAGPQVMDGELALKYVRSRHSLGIEGSDFARSKRQQKILAAIKEKLFNPNNLFKPRLIMNIIDNVEEHVTTNLKPEELVSAWQLAQGVHQSDIINLNLNNTPEGLLQDQTGLDGAYLLTPREGDFSQIINKFNSALNNSTESLNELITTTNNNLTTSTHTNLVDLPEQADAKLDVRNSTTINGLAARTSTRLQKYGFTVVNTSNTEKKNLEKTIIYDLTYGAKSADLALLQHQTKANIASEIPTWLINETGQLIKDKPTMTQPDFILILGLDYSNNP